MSSQQFADAWSSGEAYEPYVGRWSRLVAREFLQWLALPANLQWLDIGCGTGALSETILQYASPKHVHGVDASEGYVKYAALNVDDVRATFDVGNALALPYRPHQFDVVVSGIMLNFVPNPLQAVAEMKRVASTQGTVAVYVWDYAGKMEAIRYFWNAAVALSSAAIALDEGKRFPLCHPEALAKLFVDAGLNHVETKAVDVPTVFQNFDDYWHPFLGGEGPAPGYAMSLHESDRNVLREHLRRALPSRSDGSIHLIARAWGVKGRT